MLLSEPQAIRCCSCTCRSRYERGSIAGPKVLEHLVDVVLQFEGDRYGGFKIIRAAKNRFGSTNEAAIFEMNESGPV